MKLGAFIFCLLLGVISRADQLAIYQDGLNTGWGNWSWSSTHDFANASPVYSGSVSVASTISAWGSLSLHYTSLDPTDYGALQFYIHGGTNNNLSIAIYAEDDTTSSSFTQVQLNNTNYIQGGTVDSGVWKRVEIPLADFGITTPQFTRINWFNNTASDQPTFYMDEIHLTDITASPPTIRDASVVGLKTIRIYFSQAVLPGGTFQLTNSTTNVSGTWASYDASQFAADITLSSSFTTNESYRLYVSNVTNTSYMVIASGSYVDLGLKAVQVSVDADAGVHTISPYIYGVAFAPDENYIEHAGITVNRWGGNHSSRYNWRTGASNRDFDWYFENFDWDDEDGSAPDFSLRSTQSGAATILTVPALSWVAKDTTSYSYSVAKYGAQQDTNPYDSDKGNGYTLSGQPITNDITDSSVPSRPYRQTGDPTNSVYQDEWLQSLRTQFGHVAPDVIPYIAIDNEMELWGSTHRDAHPTDVTYDEIVTNFIRYAEMVRSNFPGAEILGPVNSGWWFFWNSAAGSADKSAHGNIDLIPYFLQQVNAHDDAVGHRTLDVLDIHYYPTDVYNDDTSATTSARRLRSTRSFWDPTYVDEGWIGVDHWATQTQSNSNVVWLIPRFQALITNYYPGLKLGITEWSMGGEDHISGGLAVADVLGVMGREDVDLATYWATPDADSPVYQAFKLYGNYDGSGSRFENVSVSATSTDYSALSAVAAKSLAADRLTLVLVNKDPTNDIIVSLNVTNYQPLATAAVYRLNAVVSTNVFAETTITNVSSNFDLVCPSYSATLIAFQAAATNDYSNTTLNINAALTTSLWITAETTLGEEALLESSSNINFTNVLILGTNTGTRAIWNLPPTNNLLFYRLRSR